MAVVKYACYGTTYIDPKTFNSRDHYRETWDRVVEVHDVRDNRPIWAKKAYKILDWISTAGIKSK